jgi:hypothetical protein
VSKFNRKRKGKRKRATRGDAAPPEPVVVPSYVSIETVSTRFRFPGAPFKHDPLEGMRKVDREHLELMLPACAAWRYHPGTFQLGGGNSAKPTFLFLDGVGNIVLDFVTTRATDELLVMAAMLAKIHPWFIVHAWESGDVALLPDTFTHLPPRKPEKEIRELMKVKDFMSGHELEHVQHLDDWVQRGEIDGWLYEPVAWSLGYRCAYNPDFLLFGKRGLIWQEVKGHRAKEDSIIKLKMFADLYNFFQVELARKFRPKGEGHETWEIKRVKAGDAHGFSPAFSLQSQLSHC